MSDRNQYGIAWFYLEVLAALKASSPNSWGNDDENTGWGHFSSPLLGFAEQKVVYTIALPGKQVRFVHVIIGGAVRSRKESRKYPFE